MSFTVNIKNEISVLDITKSEKISELSAFVRSNSKIGKDFIELYTENPKIAKRVFLIVKSLYNIEANIIQKTTVNFSKKKIYIIRINNKIEFMLRDLCVVNSKGQYLDIPEDYIIGSLEEMKAYIRGAFLARGSINDPKTSMYHLEFLFDKKREAVFVQRILNEFELDSKILLRQKKCMVYIKNSEKISDFLRIIGSSNAVMYYENIRVLKEQINITNRINNCEQANIDKVLISSNEQIKDIELIYQKLGKEFLDYKLLQIAEYRLKYPESSLFELSEIISVETNNVITKSGLNHRFRKIKEIANKLKN